MALRILTAPALELAQCLNVDRDPSGVQAGELSDHWRRLTSLATPEEVADWVENAVLLPRYKSAFKENSVKGFDLPMFLENPDFLGDLGVNSRLHVRQIQRAISVRLLGMGDLPITPQVDCKMTRPSEVQVSWRFNPEDKGFDGDTQEDLREEMDPRGGDAHDAEKSSMNSEKSTSRKSRYSTTGDSVEEFDNEFTKPMPKMSRRLPVHRIRLFVRLTSKATGKITPWQLAGTVDDLDTQKFTVTDLPKHSEVEMRLEAWNVVGRSKYVFSECIRTSSVQHPGDDEDRNENEGIHDIPDDIQFTHYRHQGRSRGQDKHHAKTAAPQLSVICEANASLDLVTQNLIKGNEVARLASSNSYNGQAALPEPNGYVMQDVFSDADLDGDGDIDGQELRKFANHLSDSIARESAGTNNAEEARKEKELRRFLKNRGAQVGIGSMDSDEDDVILPREFELRWRGMQRLMTSTKTADWIAHAVELPQYADIFLQHEITGFELARLMGKDANARLADLGIIDAHHQHLITRAISVLFMGLGTAPTHHFHLEAREGDSCGTIKLHWAPIGHSMGHSDEIPIHKYRLLRRQANENMWTTIYEGLSATTVDEYLDSRYDYVYRIEAWNLIGVSPASESPPMRPNTKSCVSILDMLLILLQNIILSPIYFLSFIIDNYYRIMAAGSIAGGMMMFGKIPTREKIRILRGLRERFTLVLKSYLGTSLGFDALVNTVIRYLERSNSRRRNLNQNSEDDYDTSSMLGDAMSPRSPHHALVSRAVEATFPTFSRNGLGGSRSRNGGKVSHRAANFANNAPLLSHSAPGRVIRPIDTQTEPEGSDRHIPIPLSPTSESKWEIVKRHVVLKRVVNAFRSTLHDSSSMQSDTENSSAASGDTASPMFRNKRSLLKIRKRTHKALSQSFEKVKTITGDSTRSVPPPSSVRKQMMMSGPGSMSIEANIHRCSRCNKKVGSLTRHTCGGCNLVYCRSCTAYKAHNALRACDIESKCRCIDCYEDGGESLMQQMQHSSDRFSESSR